MLAAPMDEELRPIVRSLGFKRHDDHWILHRDGTEWIALRFGIGEAGVVGRLRSAIEKFEPSRLVVAGFAGALDPARHVGEACGVNHVAGRGDGPFPGYALGDSVPWQLEPSYPSSRKMSVFTADFTAPFPDVKAALHENTRCQLIDMESFHVAALCAELELPLRIWRAVSDAAGDAIPAQFIEWLRPDGTVDKWRAVRHLSIRPWLWGRAMGLRSNAKRAAGALVKAMREELDGSRQPDQ